MWRLYGAIWKKITGLSLPMWAVISGFVSCLKLIPEVITGKDANYTYKVMERFGYVTLVECILETGRTHQIRVHMKYIGHPLFNDDFYGGDKIVKGTVFTNTNSLLIIVLLFVSVRHCMRRP